MKRSDRTTVAIVDNSIDPTIYRPVGHWSRYLSAPWQAFIAREGQLPRPRRLQPYHSDRFRVVHRRARALGRCGGGHGTGSGRPRDRDPRKLLGPPASRLRPGRRAHVRRAARPEIGWIALRLEKDERPPRTGRDEPYTFSIHFDEVCDLPRRVRGPGLDGACPIEAFRLQGISRSGASNATRRSISPRASRFSGISSTRIQGPGIPSRSPRRDPPGFRAHPPDCPRFPGLGHAWERETLISLDKFGPIFIYVPLERAILYPIDQEDYDEVMRNSAVLFVVMALVALDGDVLAQTKKLKRIGLYTFVTGQGPGSDARAP